jgi:hypothetical protein
MYRHAKVITLIVNRFFALKEPLHQTNSICTEYHIRQLLLYITGRLINVFAPKCAGQRVRVEVPARLATPRILITWV